MRYIIDRSPDGYVQVKDSEVRGVAGRVGRIRAEFEFSREFWALVVATFFFNLGVSIYFFLYNLLMLDVGYRERALGVFAGATTIGSVAGSIPMGFLARRFGLKGVVSLCLLTMAAALLARAFVTGYALQIAFAFMEGVATSGWVVCLSPAVTVVVDERRRPAAFSVIFAVAVATGSLGALFGGNLPGWCHHLVVRWLGAEISNISAERGALVVACFSIALAALPFAFLTRRPRMPTTSWVPSRSGSLYRFLIASALWALALGALNPFANVFFVRYLGAGTVTLGNFFSVAQVIQAGAVLMVPLVLKKIGLLSGITAGQLTCAAAIGLLATNRVLAREEVLFCIFLATQHMCEPAMQTRLMDTVTVEERSSAAAMNFLVVCLAQALAATLGGAALARFDYPPVLVGIAIAAGGAAVGLRLLCTARAPVAT